MAAGAGAWVVAVITTVLIVFSLGPLNWVISRFRLRGQDLVRLRVLAGKLEALGAISRTLTANKIDIAGVSSQRLGKGRYEIELELRPPPGTKQETIIAAVSSVADVEILESSAPTE
jgi:uncharacterized membrane protein YhiD involved in acid resistance